MSFFLIFPLPRGAPGQLPSEALLDPTRHQREIDCACHSQLMSSTDCLIRLPIWASMSRGFRRGKKGEKKPLFQRAQCYQMDTHWLLFISKSHTGTPSPHQHPGGLGQSRNNPNFHGALLYVYSSYAPCDMPEPVPKGTFSTPKGHCGHQLPARSPCARKDLQHQWERLTVEALLAHSPAFPPMWN